MGERWNSSLVSIWSIYDGTRQTGGPTSLAYGLPGTTQHCCNALRNLLTLQFVNCVMVVWRRLYTTRSFFLICKNNSLSGKVKIKLKNSKGEQRLNVKWLGSLQELNDFVTLVLKKTSTWQETRRKASATSIKTANLTITHYSSTQTLQFLGNKSKECMSYIKSLLDMTNDGQADEQDNIVDQTEPNQGDHTSETTEVNSVSFLGSSFSFASHSTCVNDGFRTPDITSTYPSPERNLCQDNIINYTHILERNLEEFRNEQHQKWKEHKD